MTKAALNLVVLRTSDVQQSVAFYNALGMTFEVERHGTGPEHFSCDVHGVVLEIYPASAQRPAEASTRLGFRVANVGESVEQCVAAGGAIVSAMATSPWGLRAVVADPDGRAVELTEMSQA